MLLHGMLIASIYLAAAVTWEDDKLSAEQSKALTMELAELRAKWPENAMSKRIADAISEVNAETDKRTIKEDGATAKTLAKKGSRKTEAAAAKARTEDRKEDQAQRKSAILDLKRLAAIAEGSSKSDRLMAEVEIYLKYGQRKRVQLLATQAAAAIAAGCEEATLSPVWRNAPSAWPRIKIEDIANWQTNCIKGYFGHVKTINSANPIIGGELLAAADKSHRAAWSKLRAAKADDYRKVRREFATAIGAVGMTGEIAEYWKGATSRPE